jgi:WD40 repeat protein
MTGSFSYAFPFFKLLIESYALILHAPLHLLSTLRSPPPPSQFSPNGYWVASGDATGKVRIWSWDNPEHILKLEVQVVGGGEVKDIDWDMESKRIVAVGEGQGVNAKVFGWDTGTSLGELNGHGKRVISCGYRQGRPGRLVTGSEDTRTVFYKGPPFGLERSNTEHGGWVNCVRFSPPLAGGGKKEGGKEGGGDCFVTASSDKRVLIYDGLTGEMSGELRDASTSSISGGGGEAFAHAGTIYSLAFAPSGSRLATASADKTIKIWDMENKEIEATLPCSVGREDEIGEMQNAVLWWGEKNLLSLSLNGDVNLLEVEEGGGEGGVGVRRGKVLQGHQVTITALAVERERGVFYTSSYDGVVMAWHWKEGRRGEGRRVGGMVPKTVNLANHAGKIVGLAVVGEGGGGGGGRELKSVGFDDKLRTAVLDEEGGGMYVGEGGVVGLPGQPVAIAAAGGGSALLAVIYRPGGVVLYRGGEVVWSVEKLPCTPLSFAMWGEEEVVVGGENCKVYVYSVGGAAGAAAGAAVLEGPRGQVSALAYSPGGEFLAVGDSNREVSVFVRGEGGEGWTSRVSGQWVHHTSRITALAWSPTGEYLVSGSLDSHIIVWTLGLGVEGKASRVVTLESAHKDGVTVLDWLSDSEVVSSGNDAVICVWDVAGAVAAAVAQKK